MLNKKLIFALIVFIVAISSVSATDFNATDSMHVDDDNDLGSILQNDSTYECSTGDTGVDDALSSEQTVYFDASAASDGIGTQTSPYKYFKSGRIPSGGTAYFADGTYQISARNSISSNTKLIGQSRSNTIIKSSYYYYDFIVDYNSNLLINDLTFEDVHVYNYANFECNNVYFKHSGDVLSSGYSAINSNSLTTPAIVKLTNCYFENYNHTLGAVINAFNSDIIISNCIFFNSTSETFGGVIFAVSSNLTVSNSVFKKNHAKYGGAIYLRKSTANIFYSNFTSSESYSFGGAIGSISSRITLNNCNYFNYKSSTDGGGAIYFDGSIYDYPVSFACNLNITNSNFFNGQAYFGGAISVLNAGINVMNSVFKNNTASYKGGSIFISQASCSCRIDYSKFIDSHSTRAGAIYSELINPASSNQISNYFFIAYNEFENVTSNLYGMVYNFDRITPIIVIGNKCDGQFYYNYNTGVQEYIEYSSTVPVINYSPESSTSLPSYYDSRDYGYITPVKSQDAGGNCWAFSAIATLEACLKKATGITFDLSEENLKNIMAKCSIYGYSKLLPNHGGYSSMSVAYFANWLGPIEDEWDVYEDHSSVSASYYPILNIQNVYFLPCYGNFGDNNIIKKAIMDCGAVSACYDKFSKDSSHAITLVGWNDNYNGYDYFGNYSKGVWIIKNSWGEDSGDNGFIYISYEREFLKTTDYNFMYTFVFNDTESYSKNYQYDYYGVNSFIQISGEASYKNIFTANSDEYLSAFSTYFWGETDYSVSLYVGDRLILTQDEHAPAGYYTIPFKTKTKVSNGDQFTIVINLKNEKYNYVPVCRSQNSNMVAYTNNVSYINQGDGWESMYTFYSDPSVASIKVFTTPLTLNEVTLSADKIYTVYLDEEVTFNFRLNETNLNRGLVTIKINDKTYYASVSNGQASLKISFNDLGSNALVAYYKTNKHTSNNVSFNFNVVKKSDNIVISAPDLTKYYGSSTQFAIRVTQNGNALSGASVKFIVGTSTQTATTNSNGYAYVNVNLAPGTYDVTSQYGGYSVSSKITVKSTIDVSDLSYSYGMERLAATFYNTDGSVLSNTQVKFKVGSSVYTATTNTYGVAVYSAISLNVNTYTVTAVNPVNNEEKSFRLTVTKSYPTIALSYTQNSGSVTLTANLYPISATGNVIFTVGGNLINYTRSISEGGATLTLSLKDGNYPAYVTYVGDSNCYSVKSATKTVTVSSTHDIVVSAPSLTKYYGSVTVFSIRVTDNGNALSGASVKFTKGTASQTLTTDSNGYAYVDVDWAPGTYDVKSEYGGKSVSSTITVKSTISVSDLTYDYGSSSLRATFYNTLGSVLSNSAVKYRIGSTFYSTTTNSNGISIYYSQLDAGTYDVTAINPNSNEEKSFKLTVRKVTPTISLSYTQSGESVILTASVSPTTATGNVVFTVGSNLVNFTRSISDGKATLTLTLNDGNYYAYATYNGNNNFYSVKSATKTVSVSSTHNIVISAPSLTKYYGSGTVFSIRVTDNGNALSGASVKFTKGTASQTLTTNSNGYAYVDVDWAPGTYDVKTEYGGKSVSSTITVKSTISVSDLTYDYGSSVFKATFYNAAGSLLSNTQVKFKVGSAFYCATTDSNGVATYAIKFNAGDYDVTVINPMNNEEKSFKLVVNKVTPVLTLEEVEIDGKTSVRATLSDTSVTGNIIFTFENVDYTTGIGAGISNLKINKDSGTYTVKVRYSGDSNFNSVSGSITVNINKYSHTILVADLVKVYGDTKVLTITVCDNNGKPVSDDLVSIEVTDGNLDYYGSYYLRTNSKGQIKLSCNFKPDEYQLDIEDGYDYSFVTVKVKKATSKLYVASKSFRAKTKVKQYTIILKNNKNKVLKNQRVTLKVNGKTYVAKTNKYGKATFKITKLTKKAIFKATVTYVGNSCYKKVSKIVKFYVR